MRLMAGGSPHVPAEYSKEKKKKKKEAMTLLLYFVLVMSACLSSYIFRPGSATLLFVYM